MLVLAPGARCDAPGEYRIKAAYLLNLLRFTEWPDSVPDKGTFAIGVLGADPFGDVLESTVSGKTVHGRPISIRRIRRIRSIHDVEDCRLLFIGSAELSGLRFELDRLPDVPILTVGENEKFLDAGGAVSFVLAESKVRFDVNLEALSAAHLKLDAQLLAVARRVRGKLK